MKTLERTLKAWASEKREELPERVRLLISCATASLYNGPCYDGALEDHGGWPGFERATREIREATDDIRQLWVDVECEAWFDTEPSDCEPGFDVYHVDRRTLLGYLMDRELVQYVM